MPASYANPNRIAWPIFLWPYVEMENAAKKYDFNVGFWQPNNIIPNTHTGICSATSKVYFCGSNFGLVVGDTSQSSLFGVF